MLKCTEVYSWIGPMLGANSVSDTFVFVVFDYLDSSSSSTKTIPNIYFAVLYLWKVSREDVSIIMPSATTRQGQQGLVPKAQI